MLSILASIIVGGTAASGDVSASPPVLHRATVEFAATPIVVIASGTSTEWEQDREKTTYTAATTDACFTPVISTGSLTDPPSVVCSVLSGTASAVWTGTSFARLADGSATVRVAVGGAYFDSSLSFARVSGDNTVRYGIWKPGSAARSSVDWFSDRIAFPASTSLFSTFTHQTKVYVRNASCWAATLPWEPVAVWQSHAWSGVPAYGGAQGACTLITPSIIVGANHFHTPVGGRMGWLTASGSYVQRTITSGSFVRVNETPYGGDIWIGKLDAPVTEIAPARFLPANWSSYLPHGYGHLPAVYTTQDRRIGATYLNGAESVEIRYELWAYVPVRVYDSGGPVFLPISSSSMALIGTWLTATHVGVALHNHLLPIQNAVSALAPGDSLTFADLSAFTSW